MIRFILIMLAISISSCHDDEQFIDYNELCAAEAMIGNWESEGSHSITTYLNKDSIVKNSNNEKRFYQFNEDGTGIYNTEFSQIETEIVWSYQCTPDRLMMNGKLGAVDPEPGDLELYFTTMYEIEENDLQHKLITRTTVTGEEESKREIKAYRVINKK